MYKNLPELLLTAAAKHADKTAFRHIKGQYVFDFKYSEITTLSCRIAQSLHSAGVRAGDKICLYAENSPEWFIACLAIFRLGAIVVPIDARSREAEIMPVMDKVQAKLLIAGGRQYMRASGLNLEDRLLHIDNLLASDSQSSLPHLPSISSDSPAVIIFTSGTSGASKGVVLTHGNIVSNIVSACSEFDINNDDRVFSVLPLSHALGFTVGTAGPFAKGATIICAKLKGAAFLKQILKTERVSVLVGIPVVFQALVKELENKIAKMPKSIQKTIAAARKIGSKSQRSARVLFTYIHNELGGKIKFWIAGGSHTPPDVIETLHSLGIPLRTGYGLTEASPILTVNTLKVHKTGSAGKPIPGVSIRIANPDDKGCGEILAHGPNIMSHYYENPQATKEVIKDGWLHTGDSGYIDRDGFLFITGRIKSMIVTSGGYNIFPEEMEEALEKSTFIKEICVLGKQTSHGEEPYAVIVPSDKAPKEQAVLRQKLQAEINKCLAHLADYKRLSGFEISLDPLPRTKSMKVSRVEVMKTLKGESGPVIVPDEEIKTDHNGEVVLRILADFVASGQDKITFSLSSNLNSDLQIDSFAKLELACQLEDELEIELSEDDMQEAQTVEDLLVAVKSASVAHKNGRNISHDDKGFSVKCTSWPVDMKFINSLPFKGDPFLNASRSTALIMARTAMQAYNHYDAFGVDHLSFDPPYIIAANHGSHIDTLALMAAIPPRLIKDVHPVAAADYFFGSQNSAIISHLFINAVPFYRFGNFEESLRSCAELLRKSKILIIFPEGTRTVNGEFNVFKPGVAHLAIGQQCPVIPAYIHGSNKVLAKGTKLPQPQELKVYFGTPLYPSSKTTDFKSCKEFTDRIAKAVAELKKSRQSCEEKAESV